MVWVALLLVQSAAAQDQQIKRGETLYMDAARGCAACHALKGKGLAVGPDLSVIARLSPQGIAMAVRSSATQYVQAVKLKSGETITAMPGPKEGDTLSFFDLSKTPPELKKVAKADVVSMNNTDAWKHPPLAQKLQPADIADVVAYIKATVTGTKKTVTPDEVK